MMSQSHFASIVSESLDALADQVALDDILDRYPEYRGQLAPLLEVAAMLPDLHAGPDAAERQRSRMAFLGAATRTRTFPLAFPRVRFSPLRAAAVALLALGLGGLLLVLAPGPTEASLEAVHPWLGGLPQRPLTLFAPGGDDLGPVPEAVDTGQPTGITFTGWIHEMNPGWLVVSGQRVEVTADTIFIGQPQVGSRVRVDGLLGDGYLIGHEVEVLMDESPPPDILTPDTPEPVTTPLPPETPEETPPASATDDDVPPLSETPDPGETQDTPEPGDTDEPGTTAEPDDTDEPDDTAEPDDTDEPDDSDPPDPPDEPED